MNFSEDSDYDLLEIMTWKDSDPIAAKEAWAEFYHRHVKYLYYVLLKSIKGLCKHELAEDLTSETLLRVFERGAVTFKRSKEEDPDKIRRHVRAWIGKIAHNLKCEVFRGRSFNEIKVPFDNIEDISNNEVTSYSQRNEELYHLFETVLDERKKGILRVIFMYYDPTKPNQKLPDDVLDDISQQWGITRVNIRQIKSRALKKIKDSYNLKEDNSSIN